VRELTAPLRPLPGKGEGNGCVGKGRGGEGKGRKRKRKAGKERKGKEGREVCLLLNLSLATPLSINVKYKRIQAGASHNRSVFQSRKP